MFSVNSRSRGYKYRATDILVSIKAPYKHHIKINDVFDALDIMRCVNAYCTDLCVYHLENSGIVLIQERQ